MIFVKNFVAGKSYELLYAVYIQSNQMVRK